MERRKRTQISITLNGTRLDSADSSSQMSEAEESHRPLPQKHHQHLPEIRFSSAVEAQQEQANEEDAISRLQGLRSSQSDERLDEIISDTMQAQADRLAPAHSFLGRSHKRLGRHRSPLVKHPATSLLLSFVSAVAIGLVIGVLVLKVFTGELQFLTGPMANGSSQPPLAKPVGGTETELPVQPSQSHTLSLRAGIELPQQQFFLVQAGAFTDTSSAEQIVQLLKDNGFPHMFQENNGKNHLYVSVSDKRDEALGLANLLTQSQLEVFVKEWQVPQVTKEVNISVPDSADESRMVEESRFTSFFLHGITLARQLAAYSTQVINDDGDISWYTAAEAEDIQELHRKFLDDSRVFQEFADEKWQAAVNQMVNRINQAVTAWNQAQAKQSHAKSYAWQVQQGVLSFLEHYANWAKE